MSVISLTSDTGSPIKIEATAATRIRPITPSETSFHHAQTFIQYAFDLYVQEDAKAVADLVKSQGLPSLIQFVNINGSPVWCDAKVCKGPVPITKTEAASGAKLAFRIDGALQFVQNSPDEVHNLLLHNGGTALPVVDSRILNVHRTSTETIWDIGVPELSVESTQ